MNADCNSSRANYSPHFRITGLVLDFRDVHRRHVATSKHLKLTTVHIRLESPVRVLVEPLPALILGRLVRRDEIRVRQVLEPLDETERLELLLGELVQQTRDLLPVRIVRHLLTVLSNDPEYIVRRQLDLLLLLGTAFIIRARILSAPSSSTKTHDERLEQHAHVWCQNLDL